MGKDFKEFKHHCSKGWENSEDFSYVIMPELKNVIWLCSIAISQECGVSHVTMMPIVFCVRCGKELKQSEVKK